ncbi:MAG: TonB-dependent receptor [Pseudomonadales bacterium]|nr:TonB-dependent receptor [Pseudomonadales bacterium]
MNIASIFVPALFFLSLSSPSHSTSNEDELNALFDLSLSELLQIKIIEVGSLTPSTFKNSPAAITRIREHQIIESGARTLFELLDIYVPGVQWIHHQWGANHLGTRGVISNDDDKVLLRVNGRVMNERTHFGAVTERDFPIMSDIYSIDVIRGAGSSLYGLGAVSMVIDIKTHNANTQKNNGVTLRHGGVYEFNAIEGHFSKTFNNNLGLYLYAGIADVEGADEHDAPIIFGTDVTTPAGDFVQKGTALPGPEANDGAQYLDHPPVKLHLQLSSENTEFWLRFTRAGERQIKDIGYWSAAPSEDALKTLEDYVEVGGQQLTAMLEQRYQVRDNLSLTGEISFDTQDNYRILPSAEEDHNFGNSQREDEWFAKLLAQWAIDKDNDLAIGGEVSYETFGLKTHGDGASSPVNPFLPDMQEWSTHTVSLLAEWQWRLNTKLTSFLGGRVDKNRYSATLYSPRASLVWSVSPMDTLKFMLSRSRRMNGADENRAAALEGDEESESETLDSLELRYEKIVDDSQFSLSTFYIDLAGFGWDGSVSHSVLVGEQTQWGLELEFNQQLGDFSFFFSHAYTKLLDFKLIGGDTLITAKPFGFGNDLASWSNHISKLTANYSLTDRWSFNGSLRYYWGFQGSQDFRDKYIADGATGRVDADWEEGYGKQVFLNMGSRYQLSDNTNVQLNLYNVLGWIDKDLNKRHVTDSWGFYRSEAAAFVLSLSMDF